MLHMHGMQNANYHDNHCVVSNMPLSIILLPVRLNSHTCCIFFSILQNVYEFLVKIKHHFSEAMWMPNILNYALLINF